MFDSIVSPAGQTTDWKTRLSTGHLVSFRFPLWSVLGGPETARPCLVLEVATVGDGRFATLACGLPHAGPVRSRVFMLSYPEALWTAGLTQSHQFDLGRTLTVSLGNRAFVSDGSGSPILGHLSASEISRLHRVRTRSSGGHAAGHRPAGRPAQRRRDWEHRDEDQRQADRRRSRP